MAEFSTIPAFFKDFTGSKPLVDILSVSVPINGHVDVQVGVIEAAAVFLPAVVVQTNFGMKFTVTYIPGNLNSSPVIRVANQASGNGSITGTWTGVLMVFGTPAFS